MAGPGLLAGERRCMVASELRRVRYPFAGRAAAPRVVIESLFIHPGQVPGFFLSGGLWERRAVHTLGRVSVFPDFRVARSDLESSRLLLFG